MSSNKKQFRMKPLAAALGLALVAPLMIGTALADAPGNVPVNGTVVQGSASTTTFTATTVGTFASGSGSLKVTLGSTANIIDWGNPNNTATINPNSTLAGFNISAGTSVVFSPAGATQAVVLNIDNSGNLSTLDGTLTGNNTNVFVANANGIVVGSGAVLSAPVLGLIAANVQDTSFIATQAGQNIALSFASAGSISIANGAQLNAGNATTPGTDPVLIAGATAVNIQSTNATAISGNLIVNGGASGLYTSTTNSASFTPTISVGNVALTTAPTNVSLNLGTAGGVFTLSSVYADGNITNAGNVDLKATPEFTGTLINNGIINNYEDAILTIGGNNTSSTTIYVNSTVAAPFGNVQNNGTIAAANGFNLDIGGTVTNSTNAKLNVTGAATLTNGGFSNAGLVSISSLASTNVGDFTNNGGAFSNSGTMNVNGNITVAGTGFTNMGTMAIANNVDGVNTITANGGTVSNSGSMVFGNTGTNAASNSLTVTDANFNNQGTLSLIGTSIFSVISSDNGTLAGSFSANNLSTMTFEAGANEGDTAQINTNTISSSNTVNLSGFNVNLGSSVSGVTTTVTVGGNPSVNLGTLSVASSATLAGSTTLNVNAYAHGFANVTVAGTLAGSTVNLGNGASTHEHALNNINIGGGISATNVNIKATGVVNKAMGGGTAAQNYLDNAAVITGSTVNLNVDAVGNHEQTWNIKADGNLNASSATNNFGTAGLNNGSFNGAGASYFTPAANVYSQLRLQSTGNLALVGGTGKDISGTGSFTWPGQLVAIAKGNLVTIASVDNAFTNTGAYNGIFLQGNALKITAPIYTNGGAWINFSQTGYGSNGINSNPAFMTSYYQLSEPMNNSTGVVSYASKPIDSSSLKLGRQFLKGFTPSSN